MSKFHIPALCVAALALLAACGDPSPETARKKLAEKNIAVDGKTLIEQTKHEQAQADAKLLVIAGADPNATQANGMTALMSAVFNGQADVARALIERGADVNASARGFTALRLAVEKGNKDMISLLLSKGADPALRPPGGSSAIDYAQAQGKTELHDMLRAAVKK